MKYVRRARRIGPKSWLPKARRARSAGSFTVWGYRRPSRGGKQVSASRGGDLHGCVSSYAACASSQDLCMFMHIINMVRSPRLRRSRPSRISRKARMKHSFCFDDIPECIDIPGQGACFQWSLIQWLRRQPEPVGANPDVESLRQGLRKAKGSLSIPLPDEGCGNQAKLKKAPLHAWHKILKEEATSRAKVQGSEDVLPKMNIGGYLSSVGDTWERFSENLKSEGPYRWADREAAQLASDLLGRELLVSYFGADDDMLGKPPDPAHLAELELNFPPRVVPSGGSSAEPIKLGLLYTICDGEDAQLGAVSGQHWQLFKDVGAPVSLSAEELTKALGDVEEAEAVLLSLELSGVKKTSLKYRRASAQLKLKTKKLIDIQKKL